MHPQTIAETLDYIAENDLRHVLGVMENVPHFPEGATTEEFVFGLMIETLKSTQMNLRSLALQVRTLEEAVE